MTVAQDTGFRAGDYAGLTFKLQRGGGSVTVGTDGNTDVTGDLTVSGDLVVEGTTVTLNTTELTVEDVIITAGSNNDGSAPYVGLKAERGSADAFWVWDESLDAFAAYLSSDDLSTSSFADLQADTITANAHLVMKLTGGTQDYRWEAQGDFIKLRSQTGGSGAKFELSGFNADGADDVAFVLDAVGDPSETDREHLELRYDSANTRFDVFTAAAGTGTVRGLRLYTGANTSQLVLNTDGSINTGGAVDVGGTLDVTGATTLDNSLTIQSTSPLARMKDTDSAGSGARGYIDLTDSADATRWRIGSVTGGDLEIRTTALAAAFSGANTDLAGTLDVTGAGVFDSTLSSVGAATLDTGGSGSSFGGDLDVGGGLVVSGTGPHAIGSSTLGNVQLQIGGAFGASGGLSASVLRTNTDLTAANGNTVRLSILDFSSNSITTQGNSETIQDVQSAYFGEPNITVGAGDTVANASTLKIANAPTEGTNNYALWVDSGLVQIDDALVVGSPTGGNQGAGTINATAVYDDGTLLTDYVFALAYTGETDDPIPEWFTGLYGLDETHATTRTERRLPWMPTREQFNAGERSLGSMVSRLWFGQEQQQLYIQTLASREDRLEAALRTVLDANPSLAERETALAALTDG